MVTPRKRLLDKISKSCKPSKLSNYLRKSSEHTKPYSGGRKHCESQFVIEAEESMSMSMREPLAKRSGFL